MPITLEQGEAFGQNFLDGFPKGFAKNDHKAVIGNLFAETGSWDWSDGFKGEGNFDSVWEQFSKSWGFMVNTVMMNNAIVTVDTDNSLVIVTTTMNILLDGGLADKKHMVSNNCVFKFSLDESGEKANVWDAFWNNSSAGMKAALGDISAALAEAKN